MPAQRAPAGASAGASAACNSCPSSLPGPAGVSQHTLSLFPPDSKKGSRCRYRTFGIPTSVEFGIQWNLQWNLEKIFRAMMEPARADLASMGEMIAVPSRTPQPAYQHLYDTARFHDRRERWFVRSRSLIIVTIILLTQHTPRRAEKKKVKAGRTQHSRSSSHVKPPIQILDSSRASGSAR